VTNLKEIVNYYETTESRLGYSWLTWDSKHFGYYPLDGKVISERKAQENMVELLIKKLQPQKNDKILDAGSGRGVVACLIAQKFPLTVTGIDIVPFEIQKAKNRAKKLGISDRVNFLLTDYSNTDFPDSAFDSVFTMESLVHSLDINQTLNEFRRILKPGGRLVCFEYSVSPTENFDERSKKMIDMIADGSAMFSLRKMGHGQMENYLAQNGFGNIQHEDISKNVLPSMERFSRYATGPYQLLRLLSLEKKFINTTAGVEFYNLTKKGLVQYNIYTAVKKV